MSSIGIPSINILPFVTLHHFSHPIWFEEKKGFLKKKNIIYFIKYVKYITTKLKGLVSDYCTINEPNVYAVNSFFFSPAEASAMVNSVNSVIIVIPIFTQQLSALQNSRIL